MPMRHVADLELSAEGAGTFSNPRGEALNDAMLIGRLVDTAFQIKGYTRYRILIMPYKESGTSEGDSAKDSSH